MITCPEATRLSSERLDRKLGFGESLRYRFHLLICTLCRRYSRQVEFLQKMIRHADVAAGETAGESLDSKIKERLRKQLSE